MIPGSARRLAAIAGMSVGVLFTATPVRAQSGLESVIEQFSSTAISGYIKPLADALVANLSIGYVNSTTPGKRLSISVELIGMSAAIDESMRIYTAATPNGFQPATTDAPTIFGGTATEVQHSSIPGLSYRPSDGLVDAEYFPTFGPQIRVGGLLGTDVIVRYASSSMVSVLDEKDFPELTLLGIGLQHSLSQYFTGLPIDLSIGGSFNSITFGDIVDLSATSFGITVGKSFGLLGLSGGLQSDGGTMNLTYTSTNPNGTGSVDVDIDVRREMRFRAGASLSLGFLRLFGDAAFGGVTSYAAGLRLGF